jgi:hypothetical protein
MNEDYREGLTNKFLAYMMGRGFAVRQNGNEAQGSRVVWTKIGKQTMFNTLVAPRQVAEDLADQLITIFGAAVEVNEGKLQ